MAKLNLKGKDKEKLTTKAKETTKAATKKVEVTYTMEDLAKDFLAFREEVKGQIEEIKSLLSDEEEDTISGNLTEIYNMVADIHDAIEENDDEDDE